MSKKQLCLNMSRKRAQVTVVPSWQDVFEESWGSAVVIPSHAKSITVGDPRRLSRSKALTHNGMLLMKDQVFKVNLWTRISNPSAHDDLG
jgi:hypothetical protein